MCDSCGRVCHPAVSFDRTFPEAAFGGGRETDFRLAD